METNKNLSTGRSGSAAGSPRSWLGGWSGLAVCILAIVAAVFVFGGASSGTQDAGKLLPLLFFLPCVIMMFMCMKGMGGNQGETGSDTKGGAHKADSDDGP